MSRTTMLLLLLLSAILVPLQLMAQYEIDAQVDKTEVAFGESLTLVISITQQIGSGGTIRAMTPNIEQIPGFDIASQRTGHSTSYINGRGVSRSQVAYELVPREPGDKEIPSFSFKDPEGKMYNSDPIKVKVLPPTAEPAQEPVAEPPAAPGKSGSMFYALLAGGLFFFLLVAVPVIVAQFTAKNQNERNSNIEDAVIVEEKSAAPPARPVPAEKIDFLASLRDLKKRFPEVDAEFYRHFFALFKRALIAANKALSDDMTPDELLSRLRTLVPGEDLKSATTRLAADIETVMYAGGLPARQFSAIEEDARSILAGID